MNGPHPAFACQSAPDYIVATTIGKLGDLQSRRHDFLTLLIGQLFFPSFSPHGQLLLIEASFGVGFIMRPLGGIVVGASADRAGLHKGAGHRLPESGTFDGYSPG